MKRATSAALACLGLACATSTPPQPPAQRVVPRIIGRERSSAAPLHPTHRNEPVIEDPYLWLEDVTGEQALAWVKAQNERSLAALAGAERDALAKRLLAIYDSKEKIPFSTRRGRHLYNFWQDEQNARGLLRRTTLEEFKKREPHWENVLDLDALARAENENWVYKGIAWLQPGYERCLLWLSRGGGDAIVVREYDVVHKRFILDGFNLPEAKSNSAWKDENTLYVGTDFGPGSLTESGYPRIAKAWQRGTPLTEAKTLFEGEAVDVDVHAWRDHHQGHSLDLLQRSRSLFDSESFVVEGERVERLDKPDQVDASFFREFVLFRPRIDWTLDGVTWPSGSLLAAPLADYRAGKRALQPIFTPAPNRSLVQLGATRNALLLNLLEDVHSRTLVATHEQGGWQQRELDSAGLGSFNAWEYDDEEGDRYWFSASDFVSPAKLELGDLKGGKRELIRTTPAFFRADDLEMKQFFATSKDGTRVPYFQVAKKDLVLNGDHPVLLNGYGGFEIALTPHYDPTVGAAWLERGGVFVQANIRGGGEYGPPWHEAARREHRQRAYDDFIAIAQDLIARKVTQPRRLGIQGTSNGGLLMGVMLTQRPDLWGAIVCSVPLLDMKRYHQLLAGASWMSEYGDPDDANDWATLSTYSPYQNVKKDAKYPRVLFTTSTRDDRVHPGHARKMVARMLEQGHEVLYFENIEGGHAGAANNEQRAAVAALEFEYLYQQLMR